MKKNKLTDDGWAEFEPNKFIKEWQTGFNSGTTYILDTTVDPWVLHIHMYSSYVNSTFEISLDLNDVESFLYLQAAFSEI